MEKLEIPVPSPFPQIALIPYKNENKSQEFMLSLSSAKKCGILANFELL